MKRTLILGGTFNPIHNGHIRLYRHFADRLEADRVLLIPTNLPPHKSPEALASGADRLEMCRLAVRDDPRVLVDDLELRRGAVSYTVDTLEALSLREPDARLYLIVGSDMLFTLDQWRDIRGILRRAAVCTLARHPDEYERLRHKAEELREQYGGEYWIDNLPVLELSSTELRAAAGRGEDLSGRVPAAVAAYIKQNGLYR